MRCVRLMSECVGLCNYGIGAFPPFGEVAGVARQGGFLVTHHLGQALACPTYMPVLRFCTMLRRLCNRNKRRFYFSIASSDISLLRLVGFAMGN